MNRTVFEGLSDRFFPMTFFLRNLTALTREPGWIRLPLRVKRLQWSRILAERCAFFLEVKQGMTEGTGKPPATSERKEIRNAAAPSSYCTHCGGCCEIASGHPEFPSPMAIPLSWQVTFGEGMGKGHRFCPFLWELEGTGDSLCAIHLWRPNPCRVFEQDECEVLLQDPDYIALSHPDCLRKSYRSLLQLLRGR